MASGGAGEGQAVRLDFGAGIRPPLAGEFPPPVGGWPGETPACHRSEVVRRMIPPEVPAVDLWTPWGGPTDRARFRGAAPLASELDRDR